MEAREKIKLIKDPNTSEEQLEEFLRDPSLRIRVELAKRKNLSEDLMEFLVEDPEWKVRIELARRDDLPSSIQREIASDHDHRVSSILQYKGMYPPQALKKLHDEVDNYDLDHIENLKKHQVERMDYHLEELPKIDYDREAGGELDLDINEEKELLHKLKSFMKKHNIESSGHKDLTNKRTPISQVFHNNTMLIKDLLGTRFTLRDIDAKLQELKKYKPSHMEVGFQVWEEKEPLRNRQGEVVQDLDQRYLNKPSTVIQLNLKEDYIRDLIATEGSEFTRFYDQMANALYISGHPVLPVLGRTMGWARIQEIDEDAWLIEEIQEDWGTIKERAEALSRGENVLTEDGFGGHVPIPGQVKQILTSPTGMSALRKIRDEIMADFEEIALKAVLDLARKHSVRDIYMLTDKLQKHVPGNAKRKKIYKDLPKKFHFHKEKTDIGKGENTYWHRTAKKNR